MELMKKVMETFLIMPEYIYRFSNPTRTWIACVYESANITQSPRICHHQVLLWLRTLYCVWSPDHDCPVMQNLSKIVCRLIPRSSRSQSMWSPGVGSSLIQSIWVLRQEMLVSFCGSWTPLLLVAEEILRHIYIKPLGLSGHTAILHIKLISEQKYSQKLILWQG